MPYTIESSTADCYDGSTVLINHFNIWNQRELEAVEAALVSAKAAQWEENPPCSSFDFAHYRAIHRHLFQDLYPWAGKIRTINISKKGTVFCPAREIAFVGEAVFRRLAEHNYFRDLPFDLFVGAFVDFYERTNGAHK